MAKKSTHKQTPNWPSKKPGKSSGGGRDNNPPKIKPQPPKKNP